MEIRKVAIIDDERTEAEQIRGLLLRQFPAFEIEIFESGEAFLKAEKRFALIFLDIQMRRIDGIETARQLRIKDHESVLIFVTGLKEYVFDAFDVEAFHYLLKPVDPEKLKAVTKRAVEQIERDAYKERAKLCVKAGGRKLLFDFQDIIYIESRGRKVEIHTREGAVEVYAAIGRLEEQMGSGFFRCHRCYIINMGYICGYDAQSVSVSGNDFIPISLERHKDFVRAYMRYLDDGGITLV